MAMISDFHARVGVDIDRGALQQIEKYLSDIRRRFQSFQREISRSTTVRVNARLNRTASRTALNRDLQVVGRGLRMQLDNIQLNRATLARNIQASLRAGSSASRVELEATISRSSIQAMRDQVARGLRDLVISPTINPRLIDRRMSSGLRGSGAEGTTRARDKTKRMSPTSGRTFNPWYNPMLIGGGLGAFIRYGAYSLPFVAGTMGASAITNRVAAMQTASNVLDFYSGGAELGGRHRDFLGTLGERLGFSASDISPAYGRLLAASRGTELENQIPQGFRGLMEFASVTNMDRVQVTDLFARMANRRQIRTTDLDTLVTAGMPMAFEAMAAVTTGGDVKQLRELLKGEGLDASEVLPKFFNELGRRSQSYLDDYYKTIDRQRGRAQRATEMWMENFMSGDVERALADFYAVWAQIGGENAEFASLAGRVFSTAVNSVSNILLGLNEIKAWFRGEEQDGNFMTYLFGPSKDSGFLSAVREVFSELEKVVVASMKSSEVAVEGLVKRLRELVEFLTPIIQDLARTLELYSAYESGGVKSLVKKNEEIGIREAAKERLQEEAREFRSRFGFPMPREAREAREAELRAEISESRGNIPESAGWWERAKARARGQVTSGEVVVEDLPLNPEAWGRAIGDRIRGAIGSAWNWAFGDEEATPTPYPDFGVAAVPSLNRNFGLNSPEDFQQIPSGREVPFNYPFLDRITPSPTVITKIELSGTINVEGAVSTDEEFNSSLREGIKEVFEDSFNSAIASNPTNVGR